MCHDRAGARICDFGQAKETTVAGEMTSYVATRWYRAPEQLLKAPRYTTKGAWVVVAGGQKVG